MLREEVKRGRDRCVERDIRQQGSNDGWRRRCCHIRIALDAASRAILLLVLREAALLGVGGVALGLAGAVALSRLIANRLYGMSALDPGTYSVAVGLLFAMVLLASYIPARAATRVDPLVALRTE
jgi:ABC-type antimicrobial peptide transport system permease subunit